MNRKIKFQKGGSVLSSQESLAQSILSGKRPKRRAAAERRGGRTTSELTSDEVYDRASQFLPDPRVFRKAYQASKTGEELGQGDKIDLGVETGFAALGAVPLLGGIIQKGKPMVKKFLKDKAKKLIGEAPRTNVKTGKVTSGSARPLTGAAKNAMLKKAEQGTQKIAEKANQKKIAKNLKEKIGGDGKPPAVRKTTSPAVAPKSKVPAVAPKSKVPANRQPGFNLGSTKGKGSNLKKLIGPALATGAGAYLLSSEKDAKPSAGSQAAKNKEPTVTKMSNYELADDTSIKSPVKTKTPAKTNKKKSDPTEGGRYKSYSKDNNDFMYMTQKGYDEMMDDSSGEKAGGRPGRGKLKTQGMNKAGKRKAGFSGRGSGAALRGF